MSSNRRVGWLALALLASCTAPTRSPVPAATSVRTTPIGDGRLDVNVVGIPSLEGRVIVSLHDERTYLHDDAFVAKANAKVEATDLHVVLEHVPRGRYLVVVTHDENGNDTLDTSVIGMPTEAYGFSRGARGSFGPPAFEDAAFDFDGRSGAIAVDLR